MLRILACLVLLTFFDRVENGSRLQSAMWEYSVHQGSKFNQGIQNWLRNWRP
jgi:hypothetical protein